MKSGQTTAEYVLVLAAIVLMSSVFFYFFRGVRRQERTAVEFVSSNVP